MKIILVRFPKFLFIFSILEYVLRFKEFNSSIMRAKQFEAKIIFWSKK